MDLQKLFYPKSIAVIGASRKEKTVGNDIVKNLTTQGYDGIIYPVNPKATALYGHKVYASTRDIADEIDLVIVAIPAPYVAGAIQDAAVHNNTKAAIVISAGFKEAGNEELEQELAEVCREHDVALVGPNCLGILNPEIRMNASFAPLMSEAGSVAFMSQSGALCTSILDYAKKLSLGFSKFLSVGNKALIDEVELLNYLYNDPKTKVVGMYIEQLSDAPRFINEVRKITKGENAKPIVVLKSGRTDVGAEAAASHTGSLASTDAAYEALFKQSGIIRAYTVRQLLEYLDIFSQNPICCVENVAVVTNAGGPGVLATDEIIDNGLKLAELSEDTKSRLSEFLPVAASVKNPVDILGDGRADRYQQTLEILGEAEEVDSILTILTPQSMTEVQETARMIIDFKKQCKKPMVVSFMGQDSVLDEVVAMEAEKVSTTSFPELAARGLAALGKFVAWKNLPANEPMMFEDVNKEKVREIFEVAKAEGKTSFPEAEALEIFRAYNLPLLQSEVARSPEEAKQIAEKIHAPLAMKIVSKDILHKSDVGGVMLNVTVDDVEEKYEQMLETVRGHKPEAVIEGVLLMEMAPKEGVETIVGAVKDPVLGTMLMFGLGGIFVEVLKDVNFAFTPVCSTDATRLITDLKTAELFEGVRGQKASDVQALVEALGRISQLITDFPEIKELDINPLLVLPKGQGVKVLDARLVIEE